MVSRRQFVSLLSEKIPNFSRPQVLAALDFHSLTMAASFRQGGMFCIETRFRPELFIF
jgi:hypothetical protein